MCCGFFLILSVEQVVLHFQENWIQEFEERQPLLSEGGGATYSSTHSRHHHHHHHTHQHPVISGVSNEVHHSHDGHGHHHSHLSHSMFQHSTLRSLMLLVALSFHSIFEGQSENLYFIVEFIYKTNWSVSNLIWWRLLWRYCYWVTGRRGQSALNFHRCYCPQSRDGLQSWPQHRPVRPQPQELHLVKRCLQPL